MGGGGGRRAWSCSGVARVLSSRDVSCLRTPKSGAPHGGGRRSYPANVEKSNPRPRGCTGRRKARYDAGFRHPGVDGGQSCGLSFPARFETHERMNWATRHDADLQAAEPQATEQARVPRTDEDARRTQDPQPPSQAGPGTSGRQDRRQVVGPTAGRDERYPRGARIRRTADIRALLRRGKRRKTPNLDVFFRSSPASRSRLGLIVPKHGRTIVERNRLKRRLREIGRREILPRLEAEGRHLDILLRARRSAYDAGFTELRSELSIVTEELCSRGG